MYLKGHIILKSRYSKSKIIELLDNKTGNLKKFNGLKKQDVFILKRNFGGTWGMVYKIKVTEYQYYNSFIEIFFLTKLKINLSPSKALIIILSIPFIILLYLLPIIGKIFSIMSYFIFLKFLGNKIELVFDKIISSSKNKSVNKEFKYFTNLFNSEIVFQENIMNSNEKYKVIFTKNINDLI